MGTVIQTMAVAGVPLLLAALGGLLCERSGVLNVGLEGFMLAGAFVAAVVGAASTGAVGVAVAVGLGLALGWTVAWITVSLRADQVVTGIAFNILMLGLTSYLFDVVTVESSAAVTTGSPTYPVPGLSGIPGIGVLFSLHWIAYVSYILIPIISFILFRTRTGVKIRACGEFAEGARASGVAVIPVRIAATAGGSALAALAGAYLVVGDVGVFQTNMSGGRGYIALVVIILGRWRPLGALIAAAVFGIATGVTNYLQVEGVGIPVEVTLGIPYIVSLLGIIIFSGKKSRSTARAPAEDGRPLYLSE